MVTRICPRCGRETNNHAVCETCITELEATGVSIDDLWDMEEDAYILHGLDRLAFDRRQT